MRLVTRAVTTAGVTVLGITVMGGVAQAGTGDSSLLSGLTDTVTNTTKLVDGVVGSVSETTAPKRRTRTSEQSRKSTPGLNLGVKVKTPLVPVRASVDAGVNANPLRVRAAVDVCVGGGTACEGGGGAPPTPPGPPGEPGTPPVPSEPPPPTGPPTTPPAASGETGAPAPTAMSSQHGSLPFTGAPVNALVGLGAVLVLTGAAAVASSRKRAGQDS